MKYSFILILTLGVTSLQAQNKKFPPVNDLGGDSTLIKFIAKLKTAVSQKDVKFITAQLDPKVESSVDGDLGVKTFLSSWDLQSDTSHFWPYISRALDLGGAKVNDPEDKTGRYQVVFPYVYNLEVEEKDDAYAMGAIVGERVNLRSSTDTKAKVVTQLNYDVILYLYPNENGETETTSGRTTTGDPEWYKVMTYDKKFKGWVSWKYVYSITG
ncbi:MAG TPA: SH3 domain-containing protein, partial [Saprospiraceae bacterium]|nr:SH3 domain-containing protein [Saprospiraceae bacterium]